MIKGGGGRGWQKWLSISGNGWVGAQLDHFHEVGREMMPCYNMATANNPKSQQWHMNRNFPNHLFINTSAHPTQLYIMHLLFIFSSFYPPPILFFINSHTYLHAYTYIDWS